MATADHRTTYELVQQELVAIECPVRLKSKLQETRRGEGAGDHELGKETISDDRIEAGQDRRPPPGVYDELIDRLGGARELSRLLVAKDPNRPIELDLIPNDFIHPITGEWVTTSNILIKLIKRQRRTRKPKNDRAQSNPKTINPGSPHSSPQDHEHHPPTRLYKIEPVGVIPMTVRFRALADYQYTPDLQHPINVLARSMRSLNPEGVLNFGFEPETEDYSSTFKTGLFPPPLFSRYLVPQLYRYRQNPASVVTETTDGEKRLINRLRHIPVGPQAITFDQPNVPQGPLPNGMVKKLATDEAIYQRVLILFEERPMWARMAFQNQFNNLPHLPFVRLNREILSLTCYTFLDGVFRDLLVKFGYDPRIDPQARFLQRISLRNLDRKEASEKITFKLKKRPVNHQEGDSAATSSLENRRGHIFDGLELHQSIGTYQLCDITDTLLVSLINSTKGLLPKCHVRTGWFTSNAIEQIRSILRLKFHALLDEQRILKDVELVDLLDMDVSRGAPDLLKKVSVAERKFEGSHNIYFGDREGDDEGEDPMTINPPSTSERKTKTSRPLHPNPLHKLRRERYRTKAKPVDHRVTFLDDDDGDEDVEMNDLDDGPPGTSNTEMDKMMKDASSLNLRENEDGEEIGSSEVEGLDENVEDEENEDDEDEEEPTEQELDDLSSSLSELSSEDQEDHRHSL